MGEQVTESPNWYHLISSVSKLDSYPCQKGTLSKKISEEEIKLPHRCHGLFFISYFKILIHWLTSHTDQIILESIK